MEIVLQVLDELEDLCCAVALSWSRLRILSLGPGLLAAGLWLVSRWWWSESPAYWPALLGISVTSVLAWILAVLGSFVRTLDRPTSQHMA